MKKLLKAMGAIAVMALLVFGVALTGCETASSPGNGNNNGNGNNDTEPISVTAYTVTFDPNGGNWDGSTDALIKAVVKNSPVEQPEDPDKADLGFGGWYTERYGSDEQPQDTEWDFNTRITEDGTILYAYWSNDFVTVTFDANGGTFHHGAGQPDTDTLEHRILNGRHADEPKNIVKPGFVVAYWYTADIKEGEGDDDDEVVETEWDFDDHVTTDITLFAKWEFIPVSSATELPYDLWTDGNITAAAGEQWFKFEATAASQYIHFSGSSGLGGTLTTVNVELYNSAAENLPLSRANLYGATAGNLYGSGASLTIGDEYYIRVTPHGITSSGGTYMIGITAGTTVPKIALPTSGVTTIAEAGKWTDGNIPTAYGVEWFKFEATQATQYIHFSGKIPGLMGTLDDAWVTLYDDTGAIVGAHVNLYSSTGPYANRTVTVGETYYIRVTPNRSAPPEGNGISGTYKIGFYTSTTFPVVLPTEGVTQIPYIDAWTEGYLETGGMQYFKFTATATTQYIHFSTTLTPFSGTATEIYGQLFDSNGVAVGDRQYFWLTNNISREVTVGDEYYFRVTPYGTYRGTYSVAIAESTTRPSKLVLPTTATELTLNTWTDGNITVANGEQQWFKFEATAATQYLNFHTGTLNGIYVSLFDDTGTYVGTNQTGLYTTTIQTSRATTVGREYYLRVRAYTGTTSIGTTIGTYKIAIAGSNTRPAVTLPTTGVTTLTVNTFAPGTIPAGGGDQWYKFTATATSHYLHFSPDTLSSIYVELYTAAGVLVGTTTSLTTALRSANRTGLSAEADYYLRVRPQTTGSGAFRIAFNSSNTTPSVITVPTATATALTVNTWAPGSITTAGGEQWFTFTSTGATQYIHFDASGSLRSVIVELYDADGGLVGGNQTTLSGPTDNISRAVTNSTPYYIRVQPPTATATGTYHIGFAATATAMNGLGILPTSGVTALSIADTWFDGEITAATGQQWFKFTATTATQYIHFSGTVTGIAGTLTDVYVRVYDAATGTVVGTASTNVYGAASNTTNRTVTSGQEYYIRVWPYTSSSTGTYKMAFNDSTTRPAAP